MKFAPAMARMTAVGASTVAAAALVGVGTANAAPVDKTFNFTCEYPAYGQGPMKVRVRATLPDSAKVGQPTAAVPVNVDATVPEDISDAIRLLGATQFSGTAAASISGTDGAGTKLSQNIPLTVPNYKDTGSGPVTVKANGTVQPITVQHAGTATINLDPKFQATIKFRDDAGNPTALGDSNDINCVAADPTPLTVGTVQVS